jgi:hypothetical protein
MKTNLRDLSETYASAIADQTVLAGKPIVPEDICHAFCDGFKACEAKMLAEASGGFDEFYLSEIGGSFDDESAVDEMIKEAFTAGAMSQAKRMKELESLVAQFGEALKLSCNYIVSSEQDTFINEALNKYKALKQGGER